MKDNTPVLYRIGLWFCTWVELIDVIVYLSTFTLVSNKLHLKALFWWSNFYYRKLTK
jgi:hypothetical protein